MSLSREVHRSLVSLLLAAALSVSIPVLAGQASEIDIPFEKFVLDNGLTLIVHEDHKAPIVAVNVWYHVGSKNEAKGRTGFAHLFEHLMFNGSENFDDDYFQAAAGIGATDLNGTTNEDRTNYFQNVPTSALDVALWLESDRMGHLLGAVTQEKLDEQRGVVQNEKRQSENQPYAVTRELVAEHVFPQGHPYSWTVIGKMEDLDAAAMEDVQDWFKTYYGAANAVVVLAGDIDPETARQKVQHYFGDIPSGPPVHRPEEWVAKRSADTRLSVQDRVPQARFYKVWNTPRLGTKAHDQLELLRGILTSGKSSRLYKRLVYDEQIARNVVSYVDSREIGSLFVVYATAQTGVELSRIERAVNEELARLLEQGPTREELARVQTEMTADFVRGIERIGGFGGKSDILAMSEVYAGDPGAFRTFLKNLQTATVKEVQATGREWISSGALNLEVHPFPEFVASTEHADRSALPAAGEPPVARFPELQHEKLSNGMQVILAERHATPIVSLNLLVDAGSAADQGALAGTARLAMDMMDEGAGERDALAISEELSRLGAELSTSSGLDLSSVYLSALKANLEDSLTLFADVVLNPSFPPEEFERRKKQQLASIQAEKSQPFSMALRVFPGLLFGRDHAYGSSFTGTGTEDSLSKVSRDDLIAYHRTWFKPSNATLVVVGDTTMSEIRPLLEARFKGWKPGTIPSKNIAQVSHRKSPEVFIVDKPGAIQSVIFAGHVAPPRGGADDVAIETMNTILGGTFISRLNMNLREDKHWSYGARSMLMDSAAQRPFLAYAPVQTDKTKESMVEIEKELKGIVSGKPITDEELNKIKEKKVLELPGSWETNDEVVDSIVEMVRFGLADDYFSEYPRMIRSLSASSVTQAARTVVQPDKLIWVVVGDREKIEPGIRELGLGEIRIVDADGRRVDGGAVSQAAGITGNVE